MTLSRLALHDGAAEVTYWTTAAHRGTGFALEGTKRSAALHLDGWHDMHLHARLAD